MKSCQVDRDKDIIAALFIGMYSYPSYAILETLGNNIDKIRVETYSLGWNQVYGLSEQQDKKYLQIVLDPIRVSARYKPKFGQGSKGSGVSLEEFQTLYRADPFCSWFGLDNPLMYAAHKAAGGMTSVYRHIGIGCEKLFRTILQDSFDLTDEEANWSYKMPIVGGRIRRLHLDGRVLLDKDQQYRRKTEISRLDAPVGGTG